MKSFTLSQSDAAPAPAFEIHLSPGLCEIYQSQQFPKALWLHQQLPAPAPMCSALHWVSSEQLAASLYPVHCLPLLSVPHTDIRHHTQYSTAFLQLWRFLTIPVIKKHVFSSCSLKPDLGINASCIKCAPLSPYLANYLTNMSQHHSTYSTP